MAKKKRWIAALLLRFVKTRRSETWHVPHSPRRTSCGIVYDPARAEEQFTATASKICKNCRKTMGINKMVLQFKA